MKTAILFYTFFGFYFCSFAQETIIKGKVSNKKGEAVMFANVYLKDAFDGATTNEQGNFLFATNLKGAALLVVSITGYKTLLKKINVDEEELYFDLTLTVGEDLSEVIISASAFEASDTKKGTVLKPLDIVTNPAANSDIYGALTTLPGVTPVNDQTGLFVRGGDANETKTFIDGALVTQPFFGNVPDIPSRGRFDPFEFKGVLFSTGGYSAEYGQALSSALILSTNKIPNDSEYSLSLNFAGVGGSFTKVWEKKTALFASLNYTNLAALFEIVPQNRNWIKPPNGFGTSVGFRHLTNNDGILKSNLQYQKGDISLNLDFNNSADSDNIFQNNNEYLYWNNSYKGFLPNNWNIFSVGAISYGKDIDYLSGEITSDEELLVQARLTLSKKIGVFKTRFGSELHFSQNKYVTNVLSKINRNNYSALYSETDISISDKVAARLGIRSEFVSIIDKFNIMPRFSFNYKTGVNSQISFAYGHFYQTPEIEFLRRTQDISFERSKHYILNYQWQKEMQNFRIEGYFKDYDDLMKNNTDDIYSNDGYGFSKGIDIFWRDQKTIPKVMYWVSYSFLDAERNYLDFPNSAVPSFVSSHSLKLVANYNITGKLRVGMAYTFASGRTYRNPNNNNFLSDKTIDYNNIDINSSYLTSIFGNFAVIYLSLKNPLKFKQVFNYRYSQDGSIRTAVTPSSDFSFFTGVSISFKK